MCFTKVGENGGIILPKNLTGKESDLELLSTGKNGKEQVTKGDTGPIELSKQEEKGRIGAIIGPEQEKVGLSSPFAPDGWNNSLYK